MANVSSLLKSAASRRAAIQDQKNRIADMEWNLSAKTPEDYARYTAHYSQAMENASGSDQLTYSNKLTSARRSFASNEIQRASIRVSEGNGTNEEKLNLMIGLYNGAVEAGDMDLAQNLNSQVDSFYKTIANERQQAMNLASQAYNAGYSVAEKYVDDLKKGLASPFADDQDVNLQFLNSLLREQGPDTLATVAEQISQKYGIPLASYEDMALYLAENTIQAAEAVRNQYAPGTKEYIELDEKVTALRTQDVFELPGVKMSYDELKQTAENARLGMGGAVSLVSGENGFEFVENKVANWSAVVGEDGQIAFVPNYVSAGDIRYDSKPGQLKTGLTSGGEGYALVQDGAGNQYYQTENGDLYDTRGFSTKGGKIKGKKLGNVKDFEDISAQTLTAKEALNTLNYKADENYIYLPDGQGGERPYEYKVDDRGNVQYYYTLKDAETGESTREVVTIDLQTGKTATASEDFIKYQSESARLNEIAQRSQSPQTLLQGQAGGVEAMQPAGTSALLQKGSDITSANKMQAAKLQQAATATQISQLPSQPLKVQAIPQQVPKLTVQPVQQQPKLTVAPVSPQPKVTVYQPPITQGMQQKVTVDNSSQYTGKLQVR